MNDDNASPTAQPIILESDERYCESCGYNLAGLMENRCPECGTHFNPFELPQARIPWLEVHRLGLAQRFMLTILLVFFTPISFAEEVQVAPRVDLSAATRFKYCCISLAAGLTAVLWFVLAVILDAGSGSTAELLIVSAVSCIIFVVTWIFLFLNSFFPIVLRTAGSREDLSAACLQQYSNVAAFLFPVSIGCFIVRDGVLAPLGFLVLAGHFIAAVWLRILFTRIAFRLGVLETIGAIVVLAFWWFGALVVAWLVGAVLLGILAALT